MGDADERGGAAHGSSGRPAPAIAGLVTAVVVVTLTHPVLELLGTNAEFFVARAVPRRDALLFAGVLAVLVPTLVWATTYLIGRRSAPAATVLGSVVAGVGAAALGAGLVPSAPALAAGVGAALGVVVVALVARSPATWSVARWGAAVPVASLVLFVAVLPVRTLLWGATAVVGPAEAASRPVPVVVLIFDELPLASLLDGPATIDAERYPHFAAFAEESVWYRNATTVTDRTSHAVPAILTGDRPARDALPVAAHHPRSLYTLLAPTHDVHGVEPATALCPEDVCGPRGATSGSAPAGSAALWRDVRTVAGHVLLPDAWTGALAPIDRTWGGFEAEAGTSFDLAEHALAASTADRREELRGIIRPAGGRPPAYVLHTMLPHVPYRYLPSGQELLPSPILGLTDDGMWTGDAWLRDHAQRLHLLQAGLADRVLGEVLHDLHAAGLYDQALIAVISDHGVAFRGDTHRRRAERRTLPDIAAVPLFVRYPAGPEGVVDERPVETIDLLPTIAEAVGLELSRPVAGTALTSAAPRPDERLIDAFHGPFTFLPHEADPWVVAEDVRARTGRGWPGIYATVPGGELIGRQVADLTPGPSPIMLATVDHRDALRTFRPGSDPIVGVLTGGLAFAEPPDAPVTVAVTFDGTIVALGRSTVPEGDTAAYEALVEPRWYRGGVERVAVYLVDDDHLWGPLLDPSTEEEP